MDAQEFTHLIEDPTKVHDKDAAELKRLAHDYPYSQSVQLIYAMRLKNSGEHLFNQQLGRTSILTQDRSVLFDIFENGNYSSPEEVIEKEINESLKEEDYEVVDPEELHSPEEEVKADYVVEENSIVAEETTFSEEEDNVSPEEEPQTELVEEQEEKEVASEETDSTEEESIEEEEEDLSSLPASERIKAILARSKRLQAEFEEKKGGKNSVNERVKAIRERFEKIKADSTDSSEFVPDKKQDSPTPKEEIQSNQPTAEDQSVETETKEEKKVLEDKPELSEEAIESTVEEPEKELENQEEPEVEEKEAPVFVIEEEPKADSSDTKTKYNPISSDESHNFFDWFKRLPNQSDDKLTNVSLSEPLNFDQKIELFDTFVEKLPDLKKKKTNTTKAKAEVETNTSESGTLVTETLAKVYISQGHFDKAMKAYQILKLKYPEKSSFFADRIQEIKNLKNSK